MVTTRYGASRSQLHELLANAGEPRYRADQLFEGLWTQRRPLHELTTLPAPLRHRLDDELPLAFSPVVVREDERGMTAKWLWRTTDDAQIETVLMRYPRRATVCISSQAGCAMGCTFCATGQAGFDRHLDEGEMLEQVVRAQHASPQRIGNVVFMGMGEPLANTDAVLPTLDRLHQDLGLSARNIVVSTVGIVPGMRALAEHPLPVTLAVSLHAPDDALRDTLVPINRRYALTAVLDAAREYAARKGRRVSFEYACITEVNDRPHQADALAARLRGFRGGAHVNLIPLNPTAGFRAERSDRRRLAAFAARLEAAGVHVSIRRNRGVSIDAACGQLRARALASAPAAPSARMTP